jgi:hypothetical protein|tara:strand:- start:210 stop:452 length:243 start_codon:yes stop_codon:yes gene_type:complete
MEPNDNNDILKNINDIEYKVKELEKEKEIIQDNCKHKEWTINFDEQRSIKRYCSECKRELGYATKQEEQNFLKPKGSKNT